MSVKASHNINPQTRRNAKRKILETLEHQTKKSKVLKGKGLDTKFFQQTCKYKSTLIIWQALYNDWQRPFLFQTVSRWQEVLNAYQNTLNS